MPTHSSGSRGLDDSAWPDRDDPPEDDWPDDEAGLPWPEAPGRPAFGGDGLPRGARVRPLAVVAVAVVALGVGAGVAAEVAHGISAPSPAGTPAVSPAGSPPAGVPGGSGGGLPPGGQPGARGVGRLFIAGKVSAASGTSITITAGGRAVTAAVTNSTRVTGRVTSIGWVKVGDVVSAQMTRSGGRATVTAIQDPASPPPPGGSPP